MEIDFQGVFKIASCSYSDPKHKFVYVSTKSVLYFFALVFGSQYYHVLFIISLYIVISEKVKNSCFTRKSWKNVLCLPGGLKTKTIKKSSTCLSLG